MSIYQVVLGMVIGPVKWGPGGVLVFGTGNKNVFFLETTFPILINFGLRHQSNNASSCWDSLQHPPLPKGLRGKLTPTPAFSSKNLRIYWSECTELDTDGSWARLDWRTEINIVTFGTRLRYFFLDMAIAPTIGGSKSPPILRIVFSQRPSLIGMKFVWGIRGVRPCQIVLPVRSPSALSKAVPKCVIFFKNLCQKLLGQMRSTWFGGFWNMSRCLVLNIFNV